MFLSALLIRLGREHAKFLHCGDEGYKKGIMWKELSERGQGKKGTNKGKFLHHVCVWEREKERYTVRMEMHGYRSHGVFRDSPGDALTQCLGCNVQVKWQDTITPGFGNSNASSAIHKRLKLARWKSRKHALPEGTTISQLQVICYLGRMGRSQKFMFLCEMLFVNHIHAHTTWAKKKIFFKDSVCKSWSPFVCLWALSL